MVGFPKTSKICIAHSRHRKITIRLGNPVAFSSALAKKLSPETESTIKTHRRKDLNNSTDRKQFGDFINDSESGGNRKKGSQSTIV